MSLPSDTPDVPLDALLGRLLATADATDAAFVAPPFDPAVAERVLGASGGPRTPHRRLLERRNGGYFFGGALHLFGACDAPPWHALPAWNAPDLWRDAYGDLARDLVFFAEDAFGDQFAYSGHGGEVVVFEAELGRVARASPHFVAWIEALLSAPDTVLPVAVLRGRAEAGERLAPGSQLFAYPPLCTAEAQKDVTIGAVDAVEAMRFRGELAEKLHHLPSGSRVRIELPE